MKTRKNAAKAFAYLLIFLAVTFGLFSRLVAVFRYNTFFYYDQVRDATVYMKMWEGDFPLLGPSASVGGYSLPPLYYYLVFPFTVLGPHPVFQALPNALFSFLTIPLLIYFVYQLLEKTAPSNRILLSGLAGFWYSLLYVDIFLGTFHWNPSPIPFFMLCFILLSRHQIETKQPLVAQAFLWILYGVIIAILVSLHSTTLFITPIVFIGSCVYFIFKKRKQPQKWFLPTLSVLSAVVSLTPYWKGELSRGWPNTKGIMAKIFSASAEANEYSLFQRIGRAIQSYFELGQQAYFLGFSWWVTLVTVIFFLAILVVGVLKYRGNNIIFSIILAVFLLYLYASSNFWGMSIIHNKFIILFFPIVFTVLSLAALQFTKTADKIIGAVLILGISISASANLAANYKLFVSKYSQERPLATADVIYILSRLPTQSTICNPRDEEEWILYDPYYSYKYINTYITKKDFEFTKTCQSGNYILQPKFDMTQSVELSWPDFSISKNDALEEAELFLETPVAYVYVSN